MKTQLKLNSVLPNGLGSGPDAIIIEIIYNQLLEKFGENKYSWIGINQIGDDLNEFVTKDRQKIHCNIRFPVYKNFEKKSINEQNKIRLELVHAALLRIADYEKKLNVAKLETIKREILKANFSFEFLLKSYPNKIDKHQSAELVVQPQMKFFDYYVKVFSNGEIRCRALVYRGFPVSINVYQRFFASSRWTVNEFILIGKEKEVETILYLSDCSVKVKNLTLYKTPPFYTLMKYGVSESDIEQANKDWNHSLPPAISAILRKPYN